MKKQYSIGLDIGTSSVKGVLIDNENRTIVRKSKRVFEYLTDNNGKVEIIPSVFVDTCIGCISELASDFDGESIRAMCFGSASGNLLLLDENHVPLSNIINWQDTRTENEVETVLGKDFDYQKYFESTGWMFDGKTFPLASLCRLKVTNPEILSEASYITMSTEYLIYILTGKWGISTSSGTPFYLIDQRKHEYNDDILNVFSFRHNQLPPIMNTGDIIGYTSELLPERYGIPAGVPVVSGAFDHPSAARGAGILKPGELLLSCGTSWVGFFPVSDRRTAEMNHMLIDPFLSDDGGCWAGMVSIASISALIEGFIKKYVSDTKDMFADLDRYASLSCLGSHGLKVYLDDSDNPEYILSFAKEDISRALMECVASKIGKCISSLDFGDTGINKLIMVGGPSESPVWASVISEILGIDVEAGYGSFTGAFGSSLIAAGFTR